MYTIQGLVKRCNETGKLKVGVNEITPYQKIEITINDMWLEGSVEYWPSSDAYFWLSLDNIIVILKSGMNIRFKVA